MNSCGNSNIGTKLRGYKNSDIQEEVIVNKQNDDPEKEESDILSGYSSSCDFNIPRGTLVICQRNSNSYSTDNLSRYKSRAGGGTRNEFRMARGNCSSERGRGGSRGRPFKKVSVERDSNSESGYHHTSKPKFQESLKNQENSQNDSRISKLLRRLCREDDYEHFMGLCKQLQEGILAPENEKYVRRYMDLFCENLLDTLHSGPGLEAKQQVAKCLAHVGHVIQDQDFKRYIEWIFNKYSIERKDDVKCLLMKSFSETLKMNTNTGKFKEYSMLIMSQLQSTLENVDRADLLIATVDAILQIIDSYPETFPDHFRDTVDILVGWHIDSTQQKPVVAYASRSLQKLRDFWIADLEFTLTLLGQFLEDMESYDEELALPGSGRSSPGEEASPGPRECILRITSLISVFNTVTKSISEHLNPNVTGTVQWSFLADCLSKMLRTVVRAIEVQEDTILFNDFAISQESVDNLNKCMKSINLSEKNMETLLKNLEKDNINEENIVKLIKSFNANKKNEKKNARSYVVSDKDNTSIKCTEESLINLLKSMDLKGKKSVDLSEEKEELIIVANECASLLLSYLQSRVTKNHDLLYKFIDLQLERVDLFWDETILSTLNTISKIIREVSANLPLELVHKLLGENSVLFNLRFRNSMPIQNATLVVYHSLLSLKNIPLLQEAYRYVLAEFQIAYKVIVKDIDDLVTQNPLTKFNYGKKDAEIIIIFLLRALSDIANASNSIIGMWALKPSILELLAVKLRPYDPILAVECPLLQYNILYLLYAHCSRYNHFVPSSSLIMGTNTCRPIDIFPGTLDVPTVSPTSGHLSVILSLIAKTFENKVVDQVLLLTLSWLQEISIQAENFFNILIKTEEYTNVVKKLIVCGCTTNREISLAVCRNFEILLNAKDTSWTEQMYKDIIDLAMLHLTSCDKNIREKYGHLLMNIPLNIVIPRLNKEYLISESKKLREIQNYSSESLIVAQRLYMRNNGEMQAQHFKTYMAYLLQEYYFDACGLSEIFTLCWPTISENETMAKMYKQALANSSFLLFWGGFEAAQHCVQNKLRTPLGKPQETFTTIEGALKTLAREISCNSETTKKDKRDLDQLLNEHTRVRLLIEFLEHLERVIHNASEGCAVALLPFSKPVRTFFHTNRSTCREWLNRIRLALCVVSLHAGLATNVLRNGQKLLDDLSNADNTQGAEFERAVLCTAQAMIMLGEAEALQGLYIYTKEQDRKFTWLKAAIEEAAGHYEVAAESYRQILQEQSYCTKQQQQSDEDLIKTNKSEADVQMAAFCMNHLSKCYMAISDWNRLESWKLEEEEILKQEQSITLRKQILQDVVPQQARCMKKLEEGEALSLLELSDWTLLNKGAKTNWSCSKSIIECSNKLTNIALQIRSNDYTKDSISEEIELCRKIAAKTMEEGLRNVPSEYLSDSILLQYSAAGLLAYLSGKQQQQQQKNIFELFSTDKINYPNTRILTQVLWWSEYFAKLNDTCSTEVASLRLHVARSARKEGNFDLAKREISKYFIVGQDLFLVCSNTEKVQFMDIVKNMLTNPINGKWSKNNMRAFRETSKLLYKMENMEDALRVCSVTALGISQTIVGGGEQSDYTELRETGTKLLLTLGKWLQQQDIKITENPQLEQLIRFESLHNDGLMDKLFGKTTELIPHSDMVIGKLMQLGVNQCPDLPLAWANFAAWCYKWGRKIVDNSNSGQLTDTDRLSIRSLLPLDVPQQDLSTIFSILGQNKTVAEDEGDIDVNDINTSEMIENQLRNVPTLTCASNEHLAMLVDIWRQAQKRIYSYYELSANAYFKFLQLAKKDTNDCATITATLRLLRLIVKHALELQNVLESGLSTTPTGPWKEIIPQLFSRLTHPESYVRTRVSELLCRVAQNSPHLITFPSVVGAVSRRVKSYDVYDKEESDNSSDVDLDEDDTINEGFMDGCFAQLADCLSNRIPDSVNQVKVLVKELRRITLLWDELWLATLCQHHSEISKRFEQLEHEVQKVQDNIWLTPEDKEKLIEEKHRIIVKPIVFILENLISMTSVTAETPHEKSFQEKFGPCIEEVINKLKHPKNPAKPQMAATPLKQLETKLAQRVHKRGAYSLQMTDISPTLANMKDTCIAMPGVNLVDNKIVTIRSVDNNVQILPTKTKPKKLVFHGSDGQVYTYLFKGLEDLHLDERIMQFLSICNTMMSKSNDDTKKVYRARHYSVIPLGPRSGLIQWVDGVTPLFALYKRWQQRDSAIANKASNSSSILRPSELFYNKLTPFLKERGIALENRKEWPLPVLKQVLAELMAETPKDLLAKEIWCNSTNVGSWWQATKNYSYSVAVMSIIGYIIGLGDRHLDNVLVDLNTGQVVHIDYNVCFEKGKTLRVPEKVPFRMTPNIITALGVTGVEGIFRLACEHTLRVMRRGRETLLTLLEAFVYDPLVDWRAGAENSIATYGACQARARCTGFGRKQLEIEITRAMFAVRMKEMRAEWLANRDELVKALPLLRHHLTRWTEATELSQQCQDMLQDRHQQLALVKEAQAMGRNHALYSVIKRYNTYKRAKEAHEKAKNGLRDKIEDCQKHINMHNMALAAVRGPQLAQWLAESGSPQNNHPEEHVVFELVKEFLQNAGQSQMIVHCEQSENELTQLAMQESMLIRNCLDLLSQYSAICSLYPMSMMSQHRSVIHQAWAKKLLVTGTVEACHEVVAQLEEINLAQQVSSSNPQAQQPIVAFSYQMQAILNNANERFKKAYDRMVSEGLPEALNRIEKAYVESKTHISGFLRREKGAEHALECVNITALCALNKRYLIMEGAAKCAGDCLVNLTSREGDWFLDEMRLMTSLIAELITLIPDSHKKSPQHGSDLNISLVLKCLKSADSIYKGLQELNYNFHTIILPEAMKTIITEEPSVLRMIAELDEIILSTGIPLTEILAQLEIHLRFTIMEMESPHAIVQNLVMNMRLRFEALLSRPADLQELNNQDDSLTPGQMLLMGFNGLFEKLQMEGNTLVTSLSSLDVPSSWKKIDQIREAKEMAAPIFKEAARHVLEDIFLIKRLFTIQEFFVMCCDIATAFKGGLANIYDDDRVNKPIKLFTADYVSRQLLGLMSQTLAIALCFLLQRMGLNVTTEIEQRDIGAESKVSIEELCRKVVDLCLKRGLFSGSVLAQASALSSTLESTWRRKQSARLAQQGVEIARASMQRLQLQLTAHHWLHEDSLMLRSNLSSLNLLHRPTFMLELRKSAAALSTLQSRVCEAREQQQNLVGSAVQRLKWAAGANPALGEVMSAFDNAVLTSCEKLTRQHNLAGVIVSTCNSILHYEALRTRTSESINNDASLRKLIKHWEEICMLTANLTISVSVIEEKLLELLQLQLQQPDNNNVDANWLRQAEKLVSEAIIDTQNKLQERQAMLAVAQESLKEQITNLQNVMAEHHRLMTDVRALLRGMAKQQNVLGLQEFLAKYRLLMESMSSLVKELQQTDSLTSARAIIANTELEALALNMPPLYDELLHFAFNDTEHHEQQQQHVKTNKPKLTRQDSFSPRKGARDPTTGKAVQERNAYALNVWRRVRMKLEGRDPNLSRKYTTAEQVEYVIREAQNSDNLALLYEGWTPWV